MRTDPRFPTLHIVNHPLIEHKLSIMRDKNTVTKDFRTLLYEITLLMGYEVTRDMETELVDIETPICKMKAPMLKATDTVIVPILRAGLGMTDGLLALIPTACVGHIGVYRDETTHLPKEYLVRLPSPGHDHYIVCDPMVATGHSGAHAVDVLIKNGVPEEKITFMALVSVPEGIEVLSKAHPKMPIYTAALDDHLNENAYIVPGLGDAGDRIFGTL